MKIKQLLLVGGLLASLVPAASAIALIEWDFQGVSTSLTPLAATSTATELATGTGLNELSTTGLSEPTPYQVNTYSTIWWNDTNTFNPSQKFMTFSVSPGSGQELTLSSLDYLAGGAGNSPETALWGYQINGEGWVYQPEYDQPLFNDRVPMTWDFDDFTITDTDTVEFRYWAYGATAVNGGSTSVGGQVRFVSDEGSDLVLNGIIPESSATSALYGMMAVGLIAYLRRRHAR